GRCELFRASIADIGFRRSHIVAGRRLGSVSRYTDRARIQASGSVLPQKFLNNMLGPFILALAEVVIADSSLPIDELVRRPVFVTERLPNPMVAVDGDWEGNL